MYSFSLCVCACVYKHITQLVIGFLHPDSHTGLSPEKVQKVKLTVLPCVETKITKERTLKL